MIKNSCWEMTGIFGAVFAKCVPCGKIYFWDFSKNLGVCICECYIIFTNVIKALLD